MPEMEEKLNRFVRMNQEERTRLRGLERQFSMIAFLRGVVFLAALALTLIGAKDGIPWLLAPGILLFFGFVLLVKKHADVDALTERVKSMERVTQDYVARFHDDWHKFPEHGGEYLGPDDVVAADLDLLGPNSLYQLIHVCHTDEGCYRLASLLRRPEKATGTEERRTAVEELVTREEFAVKFEAAGRIAAGRKKRPDITGFENYCKAEQPGLPVGMQIARFAGPVLFFSLLALGLFDVISLGFCLIAFLIQLSVALVLKTASDRIILPVYGISHSTEDYLTMLSMIAVEEFSSKRMTTLREKIMGGQGILAAFRRLAAISQLYNVSFNPLIHQILSGVFFWDFHLAAMVTRWHAKYGAAAADCFDVIAETEVLLSLAVPGMVRETARAEIAEDEKVMISCEELVHPLIDPEKAVGNSATFKDGVTIVTGSNMSGKTTFLRTLAINLILADLGAPICGKRLHASRMRIFTSMRIKDDVAGGISTFYAEILRIKAMADYRKENRPMLCLIDEIFKGTNSADRICGAEHAIKSLSGGNSIVIVSTHDFELCDLTDDAGHSANNLHFEESYENDVLTFDYKVKPGRCTTTNARELLRMAGFSIS